MIIVGQKKTANGEAKKETRVFRVQVTVGRKVLFATGDLHYTTQDKCERDVVRQYARLGVALPDGATVTAKEVGS